MLGYVTADRPELKLKENEVYNGYYCGICKSIGRRYGQLPRMVLSYDAAFLSLLLASLYDDEDDLRKEHCIIHHIKKKTIAANEAIDYAADTMLILAWYKLLDDIKDEKKISAKAAAIAMKRVFQKLERKRLSLCRKIESQLRILSIIEEEKCDSLDQAAEAFAKIMEAIFEEGPLPENFKEQQVLARIGYHLGKWIYLIDAVDDLEDNIESGVYNPLVYRFGYEPGEKDFRARIVEHCKFNLYHYLGEMSKALDLLSMKKNRGIIENIVYLGLNRKIEEIVGTEEI